MSVVEPGSAQTNLIGRVKAILLRPQAAWDAIDGETTSAAELYRYVAVLAAIPALCGLIGQTTLGVRMIGVSYRPPLWVSLAENLLRYGLALAMVYLVALLIDLVAPRFEGTRDRTQALKLAAYAPTAVWVAGVFNLIPAIGGLVGLVAALYSLYTLYLGLTKLTKASEERAISYFAVVLVGVILLMLVTGAATSRVRDLGGPLSLSHREEPDSLVVADKAIINLDQLEDAAMAAKGLGDAKVKVSDPDALKAYLPDTVVGYHRDAVSAARRRTAGVEATGAEARYAKGSARITLTVTDLGAAGKLAGLAEALNLKSSKESAGSYEKLGQEDGRPIQQSFHKASGRGEYSVVVGQRFMVQASGQGAAMNDLKAAVAAVGLARLEDLAKAG
jgi:hypothetical protein